MTSEVRIALVDDHRMFREALRWLVARESPDALIVDQADTAAAALALLRAAQPQLVVMDIHLPDGGGIEVSRQILAESGWIKIIILAAEASLGL